MNASDVLNAEIRQHDIESWTPFAGAQSLATSHTAREIFFGGARGPGKSWIQRLWLAKLAVEETSANSGILKYPGYKGAIFRYHAIDLRDWHSEARALYCGKMGAKPTGNPVEYRFPGGPLVRSGHLQDGGYVNYQGWEIHKLGIDEATQLPTTYSRELGTPGCPDYQMLIGGSLRLSPDGNPQAFLTGNPGGIGDRWVKHRFIKIYDEGNLIKPRTVFRDPVSGHTRVFINATVFDNPWILEHDPGFIKSLLEHPPAIRDAWIYGNWDAFQGQFFDFNPAEHVVEPEMVRGVLLPHCYRWLSCDWGYAHPCAVHGFAQGLDGRIHVYREQVFDGKVGSFELGMEIGKAYFNDLQGLPDNHMSLYLSHDAFHEEDNTSRRVDGIRAGIEVVLGPQSAFILEMNADEKREAMADPDTAVKRMNIRRSQSTQNYGITIVRADKNSVDGWNYMHELLRATKIELTGQPDITIVQHLRTMPNAEALVANYLHGFDRKTEVTPKILFHTCCPRVIETLPEMTHDEKQPEKMAKVDGDDPVDSVMYGVMAHRNMQNTVPLAYFVGEQLRECFKDRPVDMSQAHIINLQLQEKHDRLYASPAPMRLGRFAGRGRLEVQ